MSSEERPRIRRHLRFTRYLSVHCTVLSPEQSQSRSLEGTTRNVNAGGFEMLLPEALSPKMLVSVRIADADPLRGHIVSVGEAIPTVLGERFPHGVAFEEPVDASLVRRWVSHPKRRVHRRARIRFDVEFKQAGTTAPGTCLNLCKGGMFIATERPFAPGTEINVSFKFPGRSDSVSVRAHIAWMSGAEKDSTVTTGMGVKFLDLDPSVSSAIGTLVDRLCEEDPVPYTSPSPTPSR